MFFFLQLKYLKIFYSVKEEKNQVNDHRTGC